MIGVSGLSFAEIFALLLVASALVVGFVLGVSYLLLKILDFQENTKYESGGLFVKLLRRSKVLRIGLSLLAFYVLEVLVALRTFPNVYIPVISIALAYGIFVFMFLDKDWRLML